MHLHSAILIAIASVMFPLAGAAQDAPKSFVEEAHRALAPEPQPETKRLRRNTLGVLPVIRTEERGDEIYDCTLYLDRRVKCSSDEHVFWTSE